jgi:DNA-binding NarL/FixJ family response regulator
LERPSPTLQTEEVIETTVTPGRARPGQIPAWSLVHAGSGIGRPAQPTVEPVLITVLVVDDHSFVRAALMDLFAETSDILVVGECADGTEVVPAVQDTRPDLVLMDVNMPRMNGVEATRALLAIEPDARVLMLTGTVSPACIRQAQSLGAKGYLLKGDDSSALIERVREVAAGGTVWSRSAAEVLLA